MPCLNGKLRQSIKDSTHRRVKRLTNDDGVCLTGNLGRRQVELGARFTDPMRVGNLVAVIPPSRHFLQARNAKPAPRTAYESASDKVLTGEAFKIQQRQR